MTEIVGNDRRPTTFCETVSLYSYLRFFGKKRNFSKVIFQNGLKEFSSDPFFVISRYWQKDS